MVSETPAFISQNDLISAGVINAADASRTLESLAGQGITDDNLAPLWPILLDALLKSPDADRSLRSFVQWFAALPTPAPYLTSILHAPESLARFCLVAGCSQYFGDLIARNPEYFSVIEEPDTHSGSHSAAHYYRQISSLISVCRQTELKQDALRRWKAREMLRIGVRDLTGQADMPATAREFSHLADSCIQAALDIAADTLPPASEAQAPGFTVIAMGKLGGLELNYSSDIDLMFVHTDQLPENIELADGRHMETEAYLTRIAETLIRVLADETSSGNVFRVDMRLRPEGRFGLITRSLSGYKAYYESWAESWEFQALLKARPIAGDRTLAYQFMRLIEKYTYRQYPSAKSIDELKQNKRRIEEKCELEGETETNIKTGYGGIRDVEFIVQSLQLQHGYRNRRLRTPNTLTAIQRLFRAHLLSDSDTRHLTEGYIFLRNLEHRLQLLNGFQVQNLPERSNPEERNRVAMRMGFRSIAQFESDLEQHRSNIHLALKRILFTETDSPDVSHRPSDGAWHNLGSLLDNLKAPAASETLSLILAEQGFEDVSAALRALQLPMMGNEFGEMPPDTPIEFKRIAPDLMERAARSVSPDAALAGVEAIALAVPNRAQLYTAFSESPDLLDRLVRLSAGSPPLVNRLAARLEWMEAVLSPEAQREDDVSDGASAAALSTNRPRQNYTRILDEMRHRKARVSGIEHELDAISAVFQREALLTGAQEIWEDTNSMGAMRGLTDLADATLQALVELCTGQMIAESTNLKGAEELLRTVAIVGLGKLGGAELGYASDWDLLIVHQQGAGSPVTLTESESSQLAQELVSRLTDTAQKLILRGANIEIDLRLRPWGRTGTLAPSLRGYIEYYKTSAETWERQAAIKARFVAGNTRVGTRLVHILNAISYGRGLSQAEEFEVLAMKKRIESERLDPAERYTDVKLGFGGLTDIEWIAQRLQLKYGSICQSVRASNTIQALSALAAAGLLYNTEADVLIDCYNLLVRVRNALWLQIGRSRDTLPSDPKLRRILARHLGFSPANRVTAEERMLTEITGHMREARAIFERQFAAT